MSPAFRDMHNLSSTLPNTALASAAPTSLPTPPRTPKRGNSTDENSASNTTMPDAVLDDISHRRFNALRGSWVLVSPHRTKRPWQGQKEEAVKNELPSYDEKVCVDTGGCWCRYQTDGCLQCYLCPGNKRAQGDVNPKYDSTFVFVNDYSAVREQQAHYDSTETNGCESDNHEDATDHN